MKSESMIRTDGGCRYVCGGVARSVERKSKRFAKRGQCAFGGVGFGCLECRIVNFTDRRAPTLARSMTFADDGCALGVNRYPDSGCVDRNKQASDFTGQHATRLGRFPTPAIKAEDPVGL
jgi:hypothetical protein